MRTNKILKAEAMGLGIMVEIPKPIYGLAMILNLVQADPQLIYLILPRLDKKGMRITDLCENYLRSPSLDNEYYTYYPLIRDDSSLKGLPDGATNPLTTKMGFERARVLIPRTEVARELEFCRGRIHELTREKLNSEQSLFDKETWLRRNYIGYILHINKTIRKTRADGDWSLSFYSYIKRFVKNSSEFEHLMKTSTLAFAIDEILLKHYTPQEVKTVATGADLSINIEDIVKLSIEEITPTAITTNTTAIAATSTTIAPELSEPVESVAIEPTQPEPTAEQPQQQPIISELLVRGTSGADGETRSIKALSEQFEDLYRIETRFREVNNYIAQFEEDLSIDEYTELQNRFEEIYKNLNPEIRKFYDLQGINKIVDQIQEEKTAQHND